MRKQTKKQLAIAVLIFSIAFSMYTLPQALASTPFIEKLSTPSVSISNHIQTIHLSNNTPYLLIILSPQYSQDDTIIQSIHTYQQAIIEKPGWISKIIQLTNESNTIHLIDEYIETTAQRQNLTAVLLIGEDITLPIKNTYQTINKPQINTYSISNTSSNNQKTICVSLLHPTPTATYQQKQTQIITTLNRFSTTRVLTLHNPSIIIEQESLTTYSQKDYLTLANTIQASYQQNTNPSQLISLVHTPHDIICLHGHGTPHQLQLNTTTNLKLTSDMAASLQTTILAIDGCYTDSIYSTISDSPTPFISTICQSNTMHIGFFGLLSQQTTNQNHNVINSILPKISSHPTIAEAISHAAVEFDFVFTGDPTMQVTY